MTARRSALLLCVAAALGGLAMGLAYDLEGGLLIAGLIVATGAPVLASKRQSRPSSDGSPSR